jgi:dTDP-4-amino-4,6-dideoxy-D-glucose/dTDP-4-amino-2,4-dideoxy-beta-L-xylose transaminase
MIPLFKVFMSPTAKEEVAKVLESGYIGQGPKVDEFENKLSEYFNVDYVLTINTGTSAIHLALHVIKNMQQLNQDFEVLTTSLTCTATNWPILANGLKIKWIDVDPTTLNMDLDDLERKLTPQTRIIMVVHWGGYPTDLDRLKKIQNKCFMLYGFKPIIIEDAAHAFGSKYDGRFLGNHGNVVIYSLQAIKHVTSVDGGVLILPNIGFYNKAKLLRWYGIDRNTNKKDFRCESNISDFGFKFHMNDVNASIGIENLKNADWIINKHKENGKFYDDKLVDIPGLTVLNRDKKHDSSFWIYSMLVENREGFYDKMKEANIMVSQVHERNDKHTCVNEYKTSLPTLDKIINNVVSIPVGWWVTKENREYIVEKIKEGW